MVFQETIGTRRSRCAFVAVVLLLLAGAAAAATTAEKAASYVGVTSVSIEPGVLMQDDTGTIVIEIKNSGSDPVSIARAEILSSDIEVL